MLAIGLFVAELAPAFGLLVPNGGPGLRQHAATAAVAVTLAWTGLAVQAFVRGLGVPNCGCFGVHLGQELRWWVLLEDAEFVALALWVRHATLPRPSATAPARSLSGR